MLSVSHFRPRLRELLNRTDAPDLVSNALWVIAIASAPGGRHLKSADLLEPLLLLLARAISPVGLLMLH